MHRENITFCTSAMLMQRDSRPRNLVLGKKLTSNPSLMIWLHMGGEYSCTQGWEIFPTWPRRDGEYSRYGYTGQDWPGQARGRCKTLAVT